jgi:hypothetical protein
MWLIRISAIAVTLLAAIATFLSLTTRGAWAASGTPQWTVTSVSRPTNFAPAGTPGENEYVVEITNTGDAASDGSPITITDELPEGLMLGSPEASGEDQLAAEHNRARANFTCILSECTYSGVVVPDDVLIVTFPVTVMPGAPASVDNVARVSGGGAADAAMSTPTTISSTPASFGISPGGATATLSTTQAGAHPDLTTSIAFNTVESNGALAGDPKEITGDLPPGFAGDLVDTPSCSLNLFTVETCPIDTQIGVETSTLHYPTGKGRLRLTKPVYNLAPSPGELAKIGFVAATGLPAEGEISLRPSDYGLKKKFKNIFLLIIITLYLNIT